MKRILVIDDDSLVTGIYKSKLRLEGFEVEIAPDGEAGLRSIAERAPDLVVLDLMLPGMHGVEVLSQIRREVSGDDLPVIVFSNTFLPATVEAAIEAGATKIVAKVNHTPNQVVMMIRELLVDRPAPALPTSSARSTAASKSSEAAVPAAAPAGESDEEFRQKMRELYLSSVPLVLNEMRRLLQVFQHDPQNLDPLRELYRHVRSMAGNSGLAGMSRVAQLSSAFEAFVKELLEHSQRVTPSTLRTLAQTTDLLALLCERAQSLDEPAPNASPVEVLAVDDDEIALRAVKFALEKANLHPVCLADPETALETLQQTSFGLLVLDIDMPKMTGFELCEAARRLPGYDKTPIIFVSSASDFENVVQTKLSGANDLIAKPFSFIELSVKALIFLLRSQIHAP
ncbi:MAG: response regulator [Verrucomicrobiae bacterium]|nr:response regulator [Verrucomicrobiae bacterium]